ncbi:MAG: N-acetyltransferase [Chitinophagaceae bacterium]|nr:N-acetyltransferase [Chitinophagaceae bacterium]
MDEIQLKLDGNGGGAFHIMEGDMLLGEMVIGIKENILTVYHTEVAEKAEGKGFAKQLLTAMVTYARNNNLKVTPLCPYVHLQFKRRPQEYADIWLRNDLNNDG